MSDEIIKNQKKHDERLIELETHNRIHDERHKGIENWIKRLDEQIQDVEDNLSWQAKVVIVAIVTGLLSFLLKWGLGNVLS